jgi:hypothetical protein
LLEQDAQTLPKTKQTGKSAIKRRSAGFCLRIAGISRPGLDEAPVNPPVCGAPKRTGCKMTETTPQDRRLMKNRTKLVHAGRHPGEQHGFVNTPVYRGSTVLFPTFEDFSARKGRFAYATQGTPTTVALEDAWTELSGAA